MGQAGPKGSEVGSESRGNDRVPRQEQGPPVQEGSLDKGRVSWDWEGSEAWMGSPGAGGAGGRGGTGEGGLGWSVDGTANSHQGLAHECLGLRDSGSSSGPRDPHSGLRQFLSAPGAPPAGQPAAGSAPSSPPGSGCQ